MRSRRFLLDALALILHFCTVAVVVAIRGDFFDSATGWFLLFMEIFTLLFHIYYVIPAGRGTPGVPRASKWIEYGISATLGTIAVLQVGRSPRWDWIIFVGFVGSAQQTIGLLIDTKQKLGFEVLRWAFVAGCLIQVGEYIFVGWHTKLDVTFVVYVVFYSLFGFHAARGLWNKGTDPGDFMEEVYSLFGFTSKLTLFWSKYFDESQVGVGIGSALSLIATLGATVYLNAAASDEDSRGDSKEYTQSTTRPNKEENNLFLKVDTKYII